MEDFTVMPSGSVWRFQPNTDAAKAESEQMGLESWQWMGPCFCVEARIAPDLISRLEENGFSVKIDP